MNKGRKYFIEPGQRFGRLVVINESFVIDSRGSKERIAKCKCDCGNYITTRVSSLFRFTTSCGCFRKENSASMLRTHGLYHNPLFAIFRGMRSRCYYKGQPNYPDWGGRGISICDEWLNDPQLFVEWALLNGYKKGLTIERLDNNKGYSPDNCVFTDRIRQANNRRTNRIIELNGEKLSMADFCRKHDICYSMFQQRLDIAGKSPEDAMLNCGHYKPINKSEGKLNYELADARCESFYHKLS